MESSVTKNYDLIAEIYDQDMALNMRFDDVKFYIDRIAGCVSVLEIACGTGRIGIPLSEHCVDYVGIDASLPMLCRFKAKLQHNSKHPASDVSNIKLVNMDARLLGLNQKFDYIFVAFSSINYLTQPAQVIEFLVGLKSLLHSQGRILLDAFVPKIFMHPQERVVSTDWVLDYVRSLPSGGILKRSKQVVPEGSINFIKRRYEEFSTEGALVNLINTESRIRPYRPDELRNMLNLAGFSISGSWWDYHQGGIDKNDFFSVEAAVVRGSS